MRVAEILNKLNIIQKCIKQKKRKSSNENFLFLFLAVGDIGFEPMTPWV